MNSVRKRFTILMTMLMIYPRMATARMIKILLRNIITMTLTTWIVRPARNHPLSPLLKMPIALVMKVMTLRMEQPLTWAMTVGKIA
jgi:hypothetical protein